MNLTDILKPAHVLPEMLAKTKWEALDELLDQLVAAGGLDRSAREGVGRAVVGREKAGGTGLGVEVAVSLGDIDLLSRPVCALGISRTGIEYDSFDGEPARVTVLLLRPTSSWESGQALTQAIRMFFMRYAGELLQAGVPNQIHDLISTKGKDILSCQHWESP
jgi:mannitol/fructose-specific phosphotransferase system IIA component (Ntr-type)